VKQNHTPNAHGNWHIVKGRLVDLDAQQPPIAAPAAVPASVMPPVAAAPQRTRRTTSKRKS
jgi:hypothetical protein